MVAYSRHDKSVRSKDLAKGGTRIWQRGGDPNLNLRVMANFQLIGNSMPLKNEVKMGYRRQLEIKILVNSCKKKYDAIVIAEIWRNLGINFSDKKIIRLLLTEISKFEVRF